MNRQGSPARWTDARSCPWNDSDTGVGNPPLAAAAPKGAALRLRSRLYTLKTTGLPSGGWTVKVLIIEDQFRLGEFLQAALTECRYTARWVRTCKDASDALADTPFDLVVLDLGLPDGDGMELLKEWRKSGFNEPVLILSARDSVEDRVKGLDHGADVYMRRLRAKLESTSGKPLFKTVRGVGYQLL